jgi:hypothetical protein
MLRGHENVTPDNSNGAPRRSPRFQASSPGSVRQLRGENSRDDLDEEEIERKRPRKLGLNGVHRLPGAHMAFEESASCASAPAARDQNLDDAGTCVLVG